MKTRICFAVALTLLGVPYTLCAQLQYDATTFIPGFDASSAWWTRRNTIDQLREVVVLKSERNSNPNTQAVIADQSSQVLGIWAASGRNVYVGHSMGGVVARHAALAQPGRTAGIVTVASPHHGAPIANSANTVVGYFAATATTIIASVTHAVLGLPPVGIIDYIGTTLLHNKIEARIRSDFDVGAPAVADLMTTSPSINALNTPDAFPHGAIYGRVDRRLAWMKTGLSAINEDELFPVGESKYKKAVSILKGCQIVGFAIIIFAPRAYYCGRALKALTAIDERWQYFTTGQTGNVDFDGFLPTSTTAYPGTSLSDGITNRSVINVNHNDIIWRPDGINAMAGQMLAIGMQPAVSSPPPLNAWITGPQNPPPSDGMCTWWANVEGGAGSYSFQWSGVRSGTGQIVWGSPGQSGWLYLQVTDGNGTQANAEFLIGVDSEAAPCEG